MHELGGWDRGTLIIFVCHHGIRSLDAAAYFAGHGLENVRSLRGGIELELRGRSRTCRATNWHDRDA